MLFPRLSRGVSARRLALIKYAREQIFGYRCGMAGEREWLRPLRGRESVNWYWPSKYLLADFNLSHYLYSQADRMCQSKMENPIHKLDSLFSVIKANKDTLEKFIASIPSSVIEDCPTLMDLRDALRLSDSYICSMESHTSTESITSNPPTSTPLALSVLSTRRRYIDAMYYRRRLSYLKSITKKSYKRSKYKEHYLTHPDDKLIWPDNKGVIHGLWPRVY